MWMGKTRERVFDLGARSGLFVVFGVVFIAAVLAMAAVFSARAGAVTRLSGNVRVQAEILSSLSMQIVSPNDADATCPDETSCAFMVMDPHTYSSSYSDITVQTNGSAGYGLTVQAEEPNLVMRGASENIVPAGIIEERNGAPYGDQNAWSYKTDGTVVTDWTAMRTTPQTIRSSSEPAVSAETTRVTYGVSTGTNPTGTYFTTLVYTATLFDDEHPDPDPEPQYMQGFTCGSIAQGATVSLIDKRDGQSYAVSRLADGLCWMSEDLKLGGSADIQITPTYSDVSTTFTLKAETAGEWCTDNTAACVNQSLMRKTGGTGTNYAPTYLYNWYAATAGGGYDATSGMIESSICPKGWKPPHGGTGIGSFASITSTYDTVAKLTMQPLPGFNFTGFRTGATVNYPSTGGYYWSRTAVDAGNANYLVFHSNVVKPANVGNKYYGFALRCVSTL